MGVHPSLVEQSPDIAQGVNEALEVRGNADQDPLDLIGAGDCSTSDGCTPTVSAEKPLLGIGIANLCNGITDQHG